jgi:hypothetical protein
MAKLLPEEHGHWEDPIVAEVRRVRGELFAAAGYDLEEFCKRLREQQRREGRAGVTLSPRRPERQRVKRIQPTTPRKRRG